MIFNIQIRNNVNKIKLQIILNKIIIIINE